MDKSKPQLNLEIKQQEHNMQATTAVKASSNENGDKLTVNLNSRNRPPSPAPFALHTEGVSVKTPSSTNVSNKHEKSSAANSSALRAPYAQPVLDASKLHLHKRINTSVDDRIATARERRLQQQHILDESVLARRAKEEEARAKWEQVQEERKKKIDESREKENMRRKEVEERKNKQLLEDKKRAEAIVAKTDEQTKVVLRQKRNASVDRTKRWSWGAGGDTGDSNNSPSASPVVGDNKSVTNDRFSKTSLAMNTAHMTFASGLRSYESSPANSSFKSPSPARSSRNRRAHSTDTRPKPRASSKDSRKSNDKVSNGNSTRPSVERGRSPDFRQTPNSQKKGRLASPQLTEPASVSARLLAPTRASLGRSSKRDDLEMSSTSATVPLRSKSSDRKRPSSAKSDSSNSSATSAHSPFTPADTNKNSSHSARGTSPNTQKSRPHLRPSSPSPKASPSSSTPKKRNESPQLKPRRPPSPAASVTDLKETPKRKPSPARHSLPASTKISTSVNKTTPNRDTTQPSKSTPPAIKQSLRPNIGSSSRPRVTLSNASTTKLLSKKPADESSKLANQDTKSKKSTSFPDQKNRKSTNAVKPSKEVDGQEDIKVKLNVTFVAGPEKTNKENDQNKPGESSSYVASTETVTGETEDISKTTKEGDVNEKKEEITTNIKDLVNNAPNTEENKPLIDDQNSRSQEREVSIADELKNADMLNNSDGNAVDEISGDAAHKQQDVGQSIKIINSSSVVAESISDKVAPDLPCQITNETQSNNSNENLQPFMDTTSEEDASQERTDLTNSSESFEKAASSLAVEISEVAINEAQKELKEEKDSKEIASKHVEEEENQTEICDSAKESVSVEQPSAQERTSSPTAIHEKKKADAEIKPPEKKTSPSNERKKTEDKPSNKPSTEVAPPPAEEPKKKEKKLTPEEQAYKDAIAAKRKEMKEKREREEKERQERLKLEAEERAKREEAARQMAEEARLEQERLLEEERIKKEELEQKKKQEAEEAARKHEEFLREQRERQEQKAKEEAERAEKLRRERELADQKKQEERQARKKRLEMIMRRTRGGDSPTNNLTSENTSPSSLTPTGGRSPSNSTTPDRMVSPVNVDKSNADQKDSGDSSVSSHQTTSYEAKPAEFRDEPSSEIDTISLEANPNSAQINGSLHPPPIIAFEEGNVTNGGDHVKALGSAGFTPIHADSNGTEETNKTYNILHSAQDDPLSSKALNVFEQGQENGDSPNQFPVFEEKLKNQVATGNLLDL